ncbi:MAG: hypothetical protein CL949_13910 [Erythrobacter sp.]|nr:hypothetical protein [Erythrobacter sp.]
MATDPFQYLDQMRSRDSEPETVDPFAADLQRQRDEEMAFRIKVAKPDEAARAGAIAKARGLPAAVVESNLPAFEMEARAARAKAAAQDYPAIGRWAASQSNVAVAADDFDGLLKIAKALDPVDWARSGSNERFWKKALAGQGSVSASQQPDPSLISVVKGLVTDVIQGGAKAREGLRAAFSDWTDFLVPRAAPGAPSLGNFGAANAIQRYQRADARAAASRPAFKSRTAQGLYSGASSLAQMVPGIAVSVATGNPLPGLVAAGGQTGFDAYGKYRARGGSPAEASIGGALEGGVEVATELLPMGFLVERLGKVGAGRFLSGYLGREMATEQAATLAQDAVDTAIANPGKTWGQYLAERPDAFYQTALATFVASGALTGVAHVANKMQQQADAILEAQAGAAVLDKLGRAVSSSKAATRAPEAVAELVQHLGEERGVERIYVPGESVQAYLAADDDREYFGGAQCPWQI